MVARFSYSQIIRKKIHFKLLLLLLLMSTQKIEAESVASQCVIVGTTDGERMEYLLSDSPRIVHQDAMVMHTTNIVSVEFQSSKVSKVYLSTTTNAIEKINATEGKIHLEQGAVILKGFGVNEPVAFYETDGNQLWQQKTDNDGQLIFYLSSLPQGIYVIKTNHQSIKIIKK